MNRAFLLTGGNLGDRMKNMSLCSSLVEKACGKILRKSSIYETAAWGKTDQPDYLNQVLLVDTHLPPEELLAVLLSVEKDMGRYRGEKYGPRIIDIDILLYNDEVINESMLNIPHPRMQERRFVLEPMNEIAPGMVHPLLHKTMSQLLKECSDPLAVNKKSAWV
jgi:2-amino-4-hydroxy-6-hydroxymethyldihydropteridine diphosphokinase